MRGAVCSRAVILVAAAALVASGCSGGSKTSGKPGKAGKAAGGSGKSFHQQVAPGFAAAAQWAVDMPWAADGFGRQSENGRSVSDAAVAADQASYGVARVVGGTVVVPSFAPGGTEGPVWPTLQFLDAKTGKTIAAKKLPVGSLLGVSSDTVAGRPVAVVRYVASQDYWTANPATAVTDVFDASGAQVWSSTGQQVESGPWTAGLLLDDERAPRFVGGYVVKVNPGADTVGHSGASYDVLDTTGKSVLHIPGLADQRDLNHVSLVDGFAVVAHDDSLARGDTYTSHEHFTVYDLADGAKKVADVAEPDSGRGGGAALAALNGKVLVAWLGQSGGGTPPTDIAVIDTAAGTASAPATLSDDPASGLGALVDPAKSDVVVYDDSAHPSRESAVVSMSHGTVLWKQQDHNGSLIPLSLHNGTLYGVEAASTGAPGSQLAVKELAVKEADGFPAGSGYVLAPLAFTADGSPVFIEAPKGAAGITIGVGIAG